MATINEGSPDKLCAEIMADARREREATLGRAQAEAAAILAAAQAEADKLRLAERARAQADAVRDQERVLATVAVEAGRLQAGRVEAVLESVRAEIQRRLLDRPKEEPAIVVNLAAAAIDKMPGDNFVLELSPACREVIGERLAQAVMERTGRRDLHLVMAVNEAITGSGVMVRDADGRRFWDNLLASRLDRMWPEFRWQIAVQAGLAGGLPPTGGTS
jgi:vacuolar-type H+-ATPase subunit E/Vma4